MISLSEVGGLYLSTPENIKDARTKAFMYACDRQIKKLLERAEKIKVWCAIESVDEKFLDYMAADSRTLFYNSSLAPDVKRKLIANSQYWYMKLGTQQAMEEMVNIVFGNDNCLAVAEEWYMYDGKPFHFRLITDIETNQGLISEFLHYLHTIKNVRSIFDYMGYVAKIRVSMIESVMMPSMSLKLSFPFWRDMRYLDGTWLLDGSAVLNGIHMPIIVKLEITFPVSMDCSKSMNAYVTKKINLWRLDGTHLLDGSKLLNAKVEREVI